MRRSRIGNVPYAKGQCARLQAACTCVALGRRRAMSGMRPAVGAALVWFADPGDALVADFQGMLLIFG